MHLSRRQFTLAALAALVAPQMGCAPEEIQVPERSLVLPDKDFKYNVEITHNGIHDLEYAAECASWRIKAYFASEKEAVNAFDAAYALRNNLLCSFETGTSLRNTVLSAAVF